MILFLEQMINGLQLGVTLFLLAAGLTLVFGIMGVINLAHGSMYMAGAYVGATVVQVTHSFLLGVVAGFLAAGVLGLVVEVVILRKLYDREHLDQVMATFGLILLLNGIAVIGWGRIPLFMKVPEALGGAVEILPGVPYPVYRLVLLALGLVVAALLYFLISHTRIGMHIRAGATNREMIGALGVDIRLLYTLVFGFGALLAGLAGVMSGPLIAIQTGMGESILILTFVVIVIGGIGSVRGALVGSILVGLVETLGRAFLPAVLKWSLPPAQATAIGTGLSSMSVYILMATILIWRPKGLFPAHE